MAWAACCSNKQMQDLFFGESNQAMFKAAAAGRREAGCQWCYEHVQVTRRRTRAGCPAWAACPRRAAALLLMGHRCRTACRAPV